MILFGDHNKANSKIVKGLLLFFILCIVVLFFSLRWSLANNKVYNKSLPSKNVPSNTSKSEDVTIDAKAAMISEVSLAGNRKILLSKNKDEMLPIASITKLMTAVIVLENYDPLRKIEISKKATLGEVDGLKSGQTFFTKDLLSDMLIESSNGAAYAFSESIGFEEFVKLMNDKAKEIKMLKTHFGDSSGVDSLSRSTAEDLVTLIVYIKNRHPEILKITAMPEFYLYDSNGTLHHNVINTNKLLQEADWREKIMGGKTGNNKDAGQCLVLVLKSPDNDHYLVGVILDSHDRFNEMKKMIHSIHYQ